MEDSVLNRHFIMLRTNVNTLEECIFLMAGRFREKGYVRSGYGEAVAEREKNLPTGLRGGEINFAIPHTDGELVIRPAVGVLLPVKPVRCRLMEDPQTAVDCELILPIAVKDARQQILLLKKVMKVIGSPDLLGRIRNAESKSEVIFLLVRLNSGSAYTL